MPVAAATTGPTRRDGGLWSGFFLCLLLFWGGLALAAPGGGWAGRVTHVTDGDTLWVQPLQGGEVHRIRVDGIDAPEICQLHGEAARRALAERVQGQQVVVQGRRQDDYGRLLARIHLQGEDIGQWMVLAGHAWSYRHQRSTGPYAAQEALAREQRLGLWQGRAMPPRTFRRRHGSCH